MGMVREKVEIERMQIKDVKWLRLDRDTPDCIVLEE